MIDVSRHKMSTVLSVWLLAVAALIWTVNSSQLAPYPPPPSAGGSAQDQQRVGPTAMQKSDRQGLTGCTDRGERTVLNGTVASKVRRKVVLERKVGAKWVPVASKKTSKKGVWSFTTNWRWPIASVRVRLPKAKVNKKRYPQIVSTARTVTAASSRVSWSCRPGSRWVARLSSPPDSLLPDPVGVSSCKCSRARLGRRWRPEMLDRAGLASFIRSTSAKQVAVYRAVVGRTEALRLSARHLYALSQACGYRCLAT